MILIAASIPDFLDRLVLAVGWALVLFVVQGLLIGLGVAVVLGLVRGRSAELRYGLALAGLLLMAICPVVTTLTGLMVNPRERATSAVVRPEAASGPLRTGDARRSVSHSTTVPAAVPAPARGNDDPRALSASSAPQTRPRPPWRARVEGWLPAVVAAWLLGVFALAIRLIVGFVEVHDLTRRDVEPPPGDLLTMVDRLRDRLGWRAPVRCFLSRRVEVPSVVGWLRPTILMPAASLARLTARQLEVLLAHELAHIRRLDFLVNASQAVAETLLFFHPAVWWVSGRIRIEREHCCDDLAVALCGGDRLLVARTLYTLESLRSAPVVGVAATGGSLGERIRRLVSPTPVNRRRGEAGWVGAGLMAVVAVALALSWHAAPLRAQGDRAIRPGEPTIRGRVLDGAGKPIADARVRLYHRGSRWERLDRMVEETRTDADGSFRLDVPLEPLSPTKTRFFPRHVVLADHPGHAVGWRILPDEAASFRGDLILTEPAERTITVVDEDGRPVQGALVGAYGLGEPSSPSPDFREPLELRVADGPLAATTDAAGQARLKQLPRTDASFVAKKPGYAETFAFREQGEIRLTPAATLTGTVTGPDGEPLPGIEVVLYTSFMWSFEYATTDERGRYRVDGLKARGWDMGAWGGGQTGDGTYKVWIESEQFAAPTQSLTLAPGEQRALDIRAGKAGVIRVRLVEQGTKKPLAGVRIWGFDKETGSSARFNAYTDRDGRATFYSAPTEIHLSVVGPPEGTYLRGNLRFDPGAHQRINFRGGETEVAMTMPPIGGPLITVSGVCTRPDGSPISGASVHAGAGEFITSGSTSHLSPQRADDQGRFTIRGVPAGQMLGLYAEFGPLAGAASVKTPERPDPGFRVSLALRPLVTVERKLENDRGEALASREFALTPKVGEAEFSELRRTVKSDEQAVIKVDRVVPGLSYRIQEQPPVTRGNAGGDFFRRRPKFDKDVILAPK